MNTRRSEENLNIEEAKKHFPLIRFDYRENVRGRDGGSAHADPYNDVVKSRTIHYYARDPETDWEKVYTESRGKPRAACDFIPNTVMRLKRFLSMDYEKLCNDEYVMFEYQNRMWKITNFFDSPNMEIMGEAIDDRFPFEIKINLIQEKTVFLYEENILCNLGGIHGTGKLYLNGECVGGLSDFNIDRIDFEVMRDSAKEAIKNRFPEVKRAELFGCSTPL